MVRSALLLAAGFGTRLRPLTDVLPKCLVPIRGRPLLEYWLRSLADAGVERIVVNTHYLADMVREYVTRGPWASRVTLVHEPTLLGTGGTVLANRHLLDRGPFLLAHADNLSLFDLQAFTSAHASRPPAALLTMMTFATDVPETCGIVTTDRAGLVNGFFEKVANPPGNQANAAVYICEQGMVDATVALGKPVVDLSTEVLPGLLGRMWTWHNARYHRDIGSLASWRAAQRDFPGGALPPLAPDPWQELLGGSASDAREVVKDLLARP